MENLRVTRKSQIGANHGRGPDHNAGVGVANKNPVSGLISKFCLLFVLACGSNTARLKSASETNRNPMRFERRYIAARGAANGRSLDRPYDWRPHDWRAASCGRSAGFVMNTGLSPQGQKSQRRD
jgi:hypothetical protein